MPVKRLYVLVEGQTEQAIASELLCGHLREVGLEASFFAVETSRAAHGGKAAGGGSWSRWVKNFKILSNQHPGNEVRFSSWFDLYGLPCDFPGLEEHGRDTDTVRRASNLQKAMSAAVGDWRFIPYLQRHELEALVLASLDVLESLLDPAERGGISGLRKDIRLCAPEDVNDGEETAPSKRIAKHIFGYRKTLHGPLAVGGCGLQRVRSACPGFDKWVKSLEQLVE